MERLEEKKEGWSSQKFYWQEGLRHSVIPGATGWCYQYILNQPELRRKKPFREEYLEFREKFEIEYNDRYWFEFYD